MRNGARFAVVVALLLTGCVDTVADVRLAKDGAGTYATTMRLHAKSHEAALRWEAACRAVTPEGKTFSGTSMLAEPDAARKEALAKQGLAVEQWKTRFDDTTGEFESRVRFERFSSAIEVNRLQRQGDFDHRLERHAEGLYVLSIAKAKPSAGDLARAADSPFVLLMRDPVYGGPTNELVSAISPDFMDAKVRFEIRVPGEVVDAGGVAPATRGPGGEVVVDCVLGKLRQTAPRYRDGDPFVRVRFKMPEGESIPAGRLDRDALARPGTPTGETPEKPAGPR